MSKLMTLKQAEQIIESWDDTMQSYGLCMAEAGMSAVSMGYSGYDGTSEYAAENPRPNPATDPEYVEAIAVTQMHQGLRVSERSEFGEYGIVFPDDVVIPEFSLTPQSTRDEIPF